MVRDYEFGLEWQPFKAFELVAEWVIATEHLRTAHLKTTDKKGIC